MGGSEKEIGKAIVHYQECLEKYARREDEAKMLYCIGKLWKLPVTIDHLTETGVGRTVNALRKVGGDVGDRAKALVTKWKEMVAREEDNEAEQIDVEASLHNGSDNLNEEIEDEDIEDEDFDHLHIAESIREVKSPPSHDNEQKPKHKEHISKKSSTDKDEKSKHNKKLKSSHKEKEHDYQGVHKDKHSDNNKHKNSKSTADDSKSDRHKHESTKRKHDNEKTNSEKHSKSSKKTHVHDLDSDDATNKCLKRKQDDTDKSKGSKQKHASSESNHKTDSKNHKSHKRKYSDSDNEQNDDEDDESSGEKEIEEKEVKRHSNKSDRKDKHHSKSKEKDKRDRNHESKSSSSKSKDRNKHSSKDKTKDSTKLKNSSKHSDDGGGGSSKSKESSKKRLSHGSKSSSIIKEGINSGSGTSFAEALGMLMPNNNNKAIKKKASSSPMLPESDSDEDSSPEEFASKTVNHLLSQKPEPLNINISSLLPEITPNYKPMAFPILDGNNRNKMITEDETLSAIMYNKISRTKVYSGNKVAWGVVPSLFDLCTRVLQDNIDALEYTGGVPYSILKPVIERANYNQLFMLEQYNPYLMDDTDELWKLHCQRDFRSKRREEMETWRDMYQRCLEERESKLLALTANIKHSQDKSTPVRQTMLAYIDSVVKPPRNIARKQRNRKKRKWKLGCYITAPLHNRVIRE